jgi:hypothetical protein
MVVKCKLWAMYRMVPLPNRDDSPCMRHVLADERLFE